MNNKRGFTLVEMIVVIVIISTLAGLGYTAIVSSIGKSREAVCLNQLRSLGIGLENYLQDHNDVMPQIPAGRASKTEDVPALDTVLLPYMQTASAFQCPADKIQFEKSGCSYHWNFLLSGKSLSELSLFGIKDPNRIPLISDKESWHPRGTNFLYADLSTSNKARFAAGK